MKTTSARENILKKIKQALEKPVPAPFTVREKETEDVFATKVEDLVLLFADNFTKIQGKFSYCASQQELAQQLQTLVTARSWNNIYCNEESIKTALAANGFTNYNVSDIKHCDAAITGCEKLIARTGSIALSAAQPGGRTVSVYAPVHICIAYTSQLVYDVKDALEFIKNTHQNFPSMVTIASGPSRTADIEKTLVTGVHGPKEVFCFLIDE